MTMTHTARKQRMKVRLVKSQELAQQRHADHMALPATECRKFACKKHDASHLCLTGPCKRPACKVHHKPLLVHFRVRRRRRFLGPRMWQPRTRAPRPFNYSAAPVPPPGRGR